jgi:hypothetical protein
VLRSAGTLNHLTDRRQASKLDQFITIQCSVVINNQAIYIHDTTYIYDNGSWARAICHSSEDRPLHYVDTSSTVHGNKLSADRTFHSLYLLLCNDNYNCNNLQSLSVTVTPPPNMCTRLTNKDSMNITFTGIF